MKAENEFNLKGALADGINLFLGSGFSTLAYDEDDLPLPVGKALAKEMAERFDLQTNLTLAQMVTILNSTRKAALRSFLTRRFTVKSFNERYRALLSLNVRSIFTTNIDTLIHSIYADSSYYLNDLDTRGAAFNDKNALDVVSLHGCVLDETRDFTFASSDIAAAFRKDPDRWHFLTEAMQRRPTLFWGYSMEDSGTLEAINPLTIGGRSFADMWVVVTPATDDGMLQYLRAMKMQIIEADTKTLLEYLEKECPVTTDIAQRERATRDTFPGYAIPSIGTVPTRSLIDFYRGAPPSWYEVFSGRLHRSKHHMTVRNALSSGSHTIIVGAPASGKTTLLMQVMHDFTFHGHKLICESPTAEKALLLTRQLRGDQALIAVDNVTDSIDGALVLLKNPNIRVLGADRAYNIDIVWHKLKRLPITIVDVTDLTDSDIQSFLSYIPLEIRSERRLDPHYQQGIPPSLFEIIEANVVLPGLGRRFLNVLTELRQHDERLLDLLLVCAYVHGCRTPVSMDMLIAFFRGRIQEFREICRLRDQLRGMLTEYVGELDDGAQDYYTPRSVFIAEAVMNQARSEDLRRMVLRFHEQVSSFRIHRFDIFRRRAFDANLMRRVFADWEDGLGFYRDAYERDGSPYLLQQAALYLAHRRRYEEAFPLIDEALIVSKQRIPSIRNSHAIILFQANIDKEDTDGIVRQTLQQSMEILRSCYQEDERKAYHTVTFADQALLYSDRYGKAEGREYLETALAWLRSEEKRSPWNRNVRRLCEAVARRIEAN